MKDDQIRASVVCDPTRYALLIRTIRQQFALNIHGTHGISHWARVLENGRRLAHMTGADPDVVELFAILHDAKRRKEWHDHEHGRRSAEYAKRLRNVEFTVSNAQFHLLYIACANHAQGTTEGDVTIQTCWDADRLDLGRILIAPNPDLLCTEAAKSPAIRQWANSRSTRRIIPSLVTDEWGCSIAQGEGIRRIMWRWMLRCSRALSHIRP